MITAVREQLAADLAEVGVPVHSQWPDRVTVPCLLLVPAADRPYVTGGQTFGEYALALDVVVLVERGSHEVALPALEALLDAVLANTVDWGLTGIDSPTVVTVAGVDHLGTTVHLSKFARL